jgi:hypothetical protein
MGASWKQLKISTSSHVKVFNSSSYRARSLYEGMSSVHLISSTNSSLSNRRRVDFMTVCNLIVKSCEQEFPRYMHSFFNQLYFSWTAMFLLSIWKIQRITYIEVHVSSMHLKPLLIHQLEGYAVENVESLMIFCLSQDICVNNQKRINRSINYHATFMCVFNP